MLNRLLSQLQLTCIAITCLGLLLPGEILPWYLLGCWCLLPLLIVQALRLDSVGHLLLAGILFLIAFGSAVGDALRTSLPEWYRVMPVYSADGVWLWVVAGSIMSVTGALLVRRRSVAAVSQVLEKMPLQQMAIDFALQRGEITPAGATDHRQQLSRRANLFGAHDGLTVIVSRCLLVCLAIIWLAVSPRWDVARWLWLMTQLPLIILLAASQIALQAADEKAMQDPTSGSGRRSCGQCRPRQRIIGRLKGKDKGDGA